MAVSEQIEDGPPTSEDQTEFACSDCDKTFTSQASLNGHLRVHASKRLPEPEPVQPSVRSSLDPDPERSYLQDQISRLSLELKALRLEREKTKYQPPEPAKSPLPETVPSLAELEYSEYLQTKTQALKEGVQRVSADPDPAISRLEEKFDQAQKEIATLKTELQNQKLTKMQDQIDLLTKKLDSREPYSNNVQVELLRSIDKRVDKIGENLVNPLSKYLLGSSPPPTKATIEQVGESAMAEELKRKGLIA
ncbi:MAG: hypothetical protein M1503_03555 [Thaumarchaeota archaeon]|nr:hypothetical protein [Nitrososphaerota archaeon]MCL5317329.1 hypothetical protein [Nitrososphaerota archaeon]